MQSITRFHAGIANAVFQEASLVFHNTVAFHPANRVFATDADRRDGTIGRFLQGGEFPTRGFFVGLDDRDALAWIALQPHVLIETTALWEGIAFQRGQAFLIRLPFIRGTQETTLTSLLDHEEVFARLALLLATVVGLLVLGIDGAVERSLQTLMPKRGDNGPPLVRLAASLTANSSALRAGSSSCRAKA
jgi:hypothetical protein